MPSPVSRRGQTASHVPSAQAGTSYCSRSVSFFALWKHSSVTQLVTTTPDSGRSCATAPDCHAVLTCGNRTQSDPDSERLGQMKPLCMACRRSGFSP